MKTAVEFLLETLAENGILHSSDIDQAKEMEKKQIIDIFNELDNYCTGLTAEQYYNETFKDKL
jgi:hypothetical protein